MSQLKRNRLAILALGPVLLFCMQWPVFAENAADLLKLAGVKGGVIVHLGCGDGSLDAALHASGPFYVQGLSTDPSQVQAARERLLDRGVYGPVSIKLWDGRRLPYADNFANLLIVEKPAHVSKEEILRVLTPRGVALLREGGGWKRIVKPWPKSIDQWTHYFHGPDGNPVANDTVVGPPKRLQWAGKPLWARHHDHMASMTALVSANGRIFYIIDEGPTASILLPPKWRLVARDAFNGVILWKRKINRWCSTMYPLKSGPAHLLRRLVAVGDRVYVTLGIDAPVSVLDAATGKTVRTFNGSQFTKEIVVSNGTAFLVAGESPSRLPFYRRVSTYVWRNTTQANPEYGWKGTKRKILAYDVDSGRELWSVETPVAPCSLAVDGERLVFHDGSRLVCLNPRSGKTLWKGEPAPVRMPVPTNTGPRVLIYKDMVLFAGNDGKMSGWSAKTGKKIWERKQKPCGHMSLKDLYVADGLVWTAAIASPNQDGVFTGYDPFTGEKKREFAPDVRIHWFHHRCYPVKATNRYVLAARNGTEFVDLKTGHWTPNHWVRGGCIYGVMPCNGLMYAPMNACGCQMEAKITGLNALAPGPVPEPAAADLSPEARLEKGPAYGKVQPVEAGPTDWPTYRHDEKRSGATNDAVQAKLSENWQAQLTGRLTPPTIAAGKVYIASVDTHTLYALDAATGRKIWRYTAGGPIDSPPTYYRGLVLFGCNDGWVYALRATDGVLAWRFRAAPMERQIMADGKLESAWPVHGSVLVHDGVLYCVAGRSMFLDGGLRFLRLNPITGELLGERLWDNKDPVTGKDLHIAYLKRTPGNTMPVTSSDILSCDGRFVWMRSQKIDFNGKRLEIALENVTNQDPKDFHIFSEVGFLDDSYFFRSYWLYGRRTIGGYGGWYQAGRLVPAGRILCADDHYVYGYGRKPEFMVNSSVIEYQLFAAKKVVTPEEIRRVQKANRKINARSPNRSGNASDWLLRHFFPISDLTAATYAWRFEQPSFIARAMAVAGDTLFIAGPPQLIDERQAYRHFDDPEVKKKLQRQSEALDGKLGGQLWAVSKADGKVLARYALDTIPVFDGMAVAGGKLYVTTVDSRVFCLGAGTKALAAANQPLTIAWNQPENPNYLLPPPVHKEKDFDKVTKCSVLQAKLGYELRAKARKQVGLALKKLRNPITNAATFTARVKAPLNSGFLRNGFIAFGDGPKDEQLVKCGVRFFAKTASIVQGPLLSGKAVSSPINIPSNNPIKLTVMVNLKKQTVIFTANEVKLEMKLVKPLRSIKYVGYAIDSAIADFSEVKIRRQ